MLKSTVHEGSQGLSRRRFITLGLVTAASVLLPSYSFSAIDDSQLPERMLCFHNVNTGEHLESVYWSNGTYAEDALADISFMFRDLRTGKVKPIDTSLLDLLCSLQGKLKCSEPFHIISGYRTPKTNDLLRKRNRAVAKNSLHMLGQAVDLRVPGFSTKVVRRAAMELRGGGVGYYPRSRFVHIDVGPVRYW